MWKGKDEEVEGEDEHSGKRMEREKKGHEGVNIKPRGKRDEIERR